MGVILWKKQMLGDMAACYYLDEETRNVELQLLPAELSPLPRDAKKQAIDSLVQLKLVGDIYRGEYAGGMTLRQSESSLCLRAENQEMHWEENTCVVTTILADPRGYQVQHLLRWDQGSNVVRTTCRFLNHSAAPATLELLSSFSLAGLTPYQPGDAGNALTIHRARSAWSEEGLLESRTAEELLLEPSWACHGIRCERFGQVGSMPVNHWFPWLMVEDTKAQVFWGMQIAHNASWQMELYRKDEGLAVSGGLADRDFGQWMKTVAPGEAFETPQAILTVCHGGTLDAAAQRLVSYGREMFLKNAPPCEQTLPVVFNEYCTTWGNPSEASVAENLAAVQNKGIDYFVIDCGWFNVEGKPWGSTMGDYNPSDRLFPHGLGYTTAQIRKAGMVPGIWFEIENVGADAEAYQMEEHLLHKDGHVLTTTQRRFWDMRQPWVQNYLKNKILGVLKPYDFGYIKMDYNDSIGVGCDGAESLGEGLRANMAAAFDLLTELKREVPGLIVENCASGGHRLEPRMLAATAMSSFSDAHECPDIPVIAANLHRLMQPCQSQIWAVLRRQDTPQRLVYSLVSTLLGRMCISGDVTELTPEQWKIVEEGISFYKKAAPVIRDGCSEIDCTGVTAYRHLQGRQAVVRTVKNGEVLVVCHNFGGDTPADWQITLQNATDLTVKAVYSSEEAPFRFENGKLWCLLHEPMTAAAILLGKE